VCVDRQLESQKPTLFLKASNSGNILRPSLLTVPKNKHATWIARTEDEIHLRGRVSTLDHTHEIAFDAVRDALIAAAVDDSSTIFPAVIAHAARKHDVFTIKSGTTSTTTSPRASETTTPPYS
jgi:hypothetical protein